MQKPRGIGIKLLFAFFAPLLVAKDAFRKFRDAFKGKKQKNQVFPPERLGVWIS